MIGYVTCYVCVCMCMSWEAVVEAGVVFGYCMLAATRVDVGKRTNNVLAACHVIQP